MACALHKSRVKPEREPDQMVPMNAIVNWTAAPKSATSIRQEVVVWHAANDILAVWQGLAYKLEADVMRSGCHRGVLARCRFMCKSPELFG